MLYQVSHKQSDDTLYLRISFLQLTNGMHFIVILNERNYHRLSWLLKIRSRHIAYYSKIVRRCRGRYRMVVGFTTIYAICAYHHALMLRFRIQLSARCTTLCDKV